MHHLYDSIIDFDAQKAYEAKDVENLISQVQETLIGNTRLVVVLKNAHYLTTKAFAILDEYFRNQSRVSLLVVCSDKSKIFPPLLEIIEPAYAA